MPKIDIETQKNHIRDYEKVYPTYVSYKEKLEEILKKVKEIYAPIFRPSKAYSRKWRPKI